MISATGIRCLDEAMTSMGGGFANVRGAGCVGGCLGA
jgi:hypothetical protein